ncbi:MAG: cytochrome C [Edaphobacter sp.]|uniref:c-type cytochrome domain-containing protein n=1 Tax=Edaphobacter sp. TaxID=1934404 RepID=UPI002398CD41|nr:c-type cytochrome domain-containing protein [Edaphobacter sp.]MDE1177041.1 cytochrome C [Edaphobacter sp.]
MRSLWGGLGLAILAMTITGCNTVNQPTPPVPGSTSDAASPEFYTGHVRPIFEKYCFRCHAGMNHRGGLSMATSASMRKGGKSGIDIVPGHPESSMMMKLIRHEGTAHDPENMPSKSAKLADADIATVERWIRAGALMPGDPPRP